MEVVVCKHARQGAGRMSGDAGALLECEVKTLMTPGYAIPTNLPF